MKTICKQNANNLGCFHIYVNLSNLWKYWFYAFLPQQFLYFLPLPHGHGSFLPIFGPSFLTVLSTFVPILAPPSTLWIASNAAPVIFTVSCLFVSPAALIVCIEQLGLFDHMHEVQYHFLIRPYYQYDPSIFRQQL